MGVAAVWFNVVVCLGVPLGGLVWLVVRHRGLVPLFLLGVVGFLVSQLVLRIPLLGVLQRQAAVQLFAAANPLAWLLVLALSAGLFEEVARWLLMRRRAQRSSFSLLIPLAYGLGHGGLECALVGANNVAILASPFMLLQVTPMVALAGVERITAMMAQVGLSIVVYLALTRRKPAILALAIALHGGVDLLTGLTLLGIPALALEAILLAAGAALLYGSIHAARRWAPRDAVS